MFDATPADPIVCVQITPHSTWQGPASEAPKAAKTIEELTAEHVGWYASNDEERWSGGPFDTREEAEAVARKDELRLIAQGSTRAVRVSKLFFSCDFLDAAEEAISDLQNEDGDPILDFTSEATADLERRVRQAIDEWQVAHQLSPQPSLFDWCRDEPSQWGIEDAAPAEGGAA